MKLDWLGVTDIRSESAPDTALTIDAGKFGAYQGPAVQWIPAEIRAALNEWAAGLGDSSGYWRLARVWDVDKVTDPSRTKWGNVTVTMAPDFVKSVKAAAQHKAD